MYKIVIKNDRYHSLKWIHTFVLLINGLAFTAIGYFRSDSFMFVWAVAMAVSVIMIWNEQKFGNNRFLKRANFASTGLIWALFAWIFAGSWLMVSIILILLLIQFSLKKKFEIIFSDVNIHIPFFTKKNYTWLELQNVVLKDGLLTIDFKSNRLLQNEILSEESTVSTEEDFNEYCRKQLGMRYN